VLHKLYTHFTTIQTHPICELAGFILTRSTDVCW